MQTYCTGNNAGHALLPPSTGNCTTTITASVAEQGTLSSAVQSSIHVCTMFRWKDQLTSSECLGSKRLGKLKDTQADSQSMLHILSAGEGLRTN